MSDTFFDKLQKDFPKMYDNVYCGMWCDKGWQNIIHELSQSIQDYIDRSNAHRQWLIDNDKDYGVPIGEPITQVTVAQIKEKFGGLRFYYDGGDEYISGLVDMAERWAESTCEVCGQSGRLRSGGWMKTLCDEHEEERRTRHGQV